MTTYRKLTATFPEDARADDALWHAARLLERANRHSDAAKVYEELQAKYPARERAAEALFWAGWAHYSAKNYANATARWQTIVKEYPKSSSYARALFWLGKEAQRRGQTNEAKNYWKQAAALNNGYYSWRAQERLAPSPNNISYDLTRYAYESAQDRAEFEKWLATWTGAAPVTTTLDAATRGDVRYRRGAELLRLARTIDALRRARPDLAFATDFIVGFPGETEDDFRDSLDLIEQVGYAGAFSFKYSPRPGTPAAEMEQLPDTVKSERLARLQAAIDRHQAAFNARCLGRTFDVLFEKAGRLPGQLIGRSPYLQPVQVMAPAELIGEIRPVTITELGTHSLFGALAQDQARPQAMQGIGA